MALDVTTLRSSFELVAARQPLVVRRFYAILFERYPELELLFNPNNRAKQEEMLTAALVAVLDHIEDASWLETTLAGLGARHVSYGVTEPMYEQVSECLRAAMAEAAGDDWSDAIDHAWADALGAIKTLMLAGTEEALGGQPPLAAEARSR